VAIDIPCGADITVGSRVSFRVSTKKPGYLILVDVDAASKLTQIYPNPMSRRPRARAAGATIMRPGRRPRLQFQPLATALPGSIQ
jgi:hypothetical protein